jgi:outer membrane protein OmpA-like peptidoglycan-associated protein
MERAKSSWKGMVVALPAFAIGACAMLPERDAQVDEARAAVLAAQNDPQVVSLAPVELNKAVEAMRRTDAAWSDRADLGQVHHLAYLAWTRAAIATETARQKSAEASVASANAERDRVRLEARTREAAQAERQAALAQRNAQRAQAQAEANRQDALEAQRQAAGAAQQAQAARAQADAAREQAMDAQTRAQSLEAALRDLQARPTDRGMVVTLGDLLFDTGRAQLNPGGLRAVDHLVAFMNAYPQRRVSIEGFTDSVGRPDANQALSERRASAVRLALIDRGIDPARLLARGYGEEYPVASNGNSAGRQMNRRVEIVISDAQGMIGSRGAPPMANTARAPRG